MARLLLTSARLALLIIMLLAITPNAFSADLYYSFHDGDRGGLASVTIDPKSGEVSQHSVHYHDAACHQPMKFVLSDSRTRAVLINLADGQHNVVVMDFNTQPTSVKVLDFPSEPDEIRAFGEMAIIGGDSGNICVVDMKTGEIVARFNARRQLRPSGHKAEDIQVLSCQTKALVSFQKDSSSGKHRGSRVLLLSLPSLDVIHDVQLPRNRPDLHYPLAKSLREQGPNPEVIVTSPTTNTLFLSLDLYGAVAMADLDDVVERGVLENLVYLPTAVDESWGNTFPDRMTRFTVEGRDYVLVCNAGPAGGSVLVDLAHRQVIQRMGTGFGIETPAYVQSAGLLVAAAAGKRKQRGDDGLDKTFHPRAELQLFNIIQSGEKVQLGTELITMPWHVYRAFALDVTSSALVLLVVGTRSPDTLVLYDTLARRIITQWPAHGQVMRAAVTR